MSRRYAPLARSSAAHAESWVGRMFPPGWCLAWLLTRVYGLRSEWETAAAYLEASRAAGTLQPITDPADIPAGAVIVWAGDPGHVAYAAGGSTIVTTDLPDRGRVGRADLEAVTAAWGLEVAGYTTTTPTGVELIREPAQPPALRFLKDPARPAGDPTRIVAAGTPVHVRDDGQTATLAGVLLEAPVMVVKSDPSRRHRVVKPGGAQLHAGPGGQLTANLSAGDLLSVRDQHTLEGTSWLQLSDGRQWVRASQVKHP